MTGSACSPTVPTDTGSLRNHPPTCSYYTLYGTKKSPAPEVVFEVLVLLRGGGSVQESLGEGEECVK